MREQIDKMLIELPGMTTESTTDLAVGVAGLTDYLKLLLEENPQLSKIWVVGEVSSARNHKQGCFFTLPGAGWISGGELRGVANRSFLKSQLCLKWVNKLPYLVKFACIQSAAPISSRCGKFCPAGEGLQALRYRQLRSRPCGSKVYLIWLESALYRPIPRR